MPASAPRRRGRGKRLVSDINVVPYIDVMLVLLVIFIVTAPLLTNSVKLALPRATTNPTENKPTTIEFSIDADGNLHPDVETSIHGRTLAIDVKDSDGNVIASAGEDVSDVLMNGTGTLLGVLVVRAGAAVWGRLRRGTTEPEGAAVSGRL